MTYAQTDAQRDQIARAFTYHPPHGDQQQRYVAIRQTMRETAELLVTFCPPSRELAVALTKLEEASMWANAAIARNEPKPEGG